jgi:hypothetical protein
MHASERISQASVFERGPVLSRVEVWGDLDVNNDKFCGRSRRVLWMKTVTQKDVREIARSMGMPHAVSSGSISVPRTLKDLALRERIAFDSAAEAWAKKHGARDRVTASAPEQPLLQQKDLLKLLAPRIVRTRKEIARDIGDFYDLTPEDSYSYTDRLEELLAEGEGVRMVEDIDNRGTDGYVLQTRRRH